MRVVLDARIFGPTHGARFHRELLDIFGWGYDGRHAVVVEPEDSPDFQQWMGDRDQLTQDICKLALEAGLLAEREESAPKYTIHVAAISDDAATWKSREEVALSPKSARALLARPLKVLVENRLNDGAFLRALAKVRYGAKYQQAISERWLEVDSAGGITTNHALVEVTTKDDAKTRIRLWVLFDSDALSPGRAHANARKLEGMCRARNVSHHRLTRRAIENYLPLQALREWRYQGSSEEQKIRRRRIEALGRLREEQRHHYNMKFGFDGDKDREDIANVGSLYTDTAPDTLDALRSGVDHNIANLFHETTAKIKEEWLVADGQEEEIHKIFTELLSLV